MTPAEAAAALFKAIPQPISLAQLEEYGVEASDSTAQQIAREILSLNLYWVLAAVDAHIPTRYQATLNEELLESIRTEWWESGRFGNDPWLDYQKELNERRTRYAHLVDQEGISPMGVCAETVSLIEDQGMIPPGDREKLLVLLIDYAPASEYGRLLETVG